MRSPWHVWRNTRREEIGRTSFHSAESQTYFSGKSRLRRADCLYTVGTIDKRVRDWLQSPKSVPHDAPAGFWPDKTRVQKLTERLGWSHFKEILYLEDSLQRDFYADMCRIQGWSVRTLRGRVQGMFFERTAISRRPEETIQADLAGLKEQDRLTTDLVFRDPYLLDFLGLADSYSEKDLETAILRELERFLLELGSDFTFVARQKRITVGNEDFYLDLLFYHRALRRLVAIELKLGRFEPAHKGQMELYLRWLDKHERHQDSEDSPIGLILC